VPVAVVLIMLFAVMVMVKNIDIGREEQPIVASDLSDAEEAIRAAQPRKLVEISGPW
jgi:hypothetical protein